MSDLEKKRDVPKLAQEAVDLALDASIPVEDTIRHHAGNDRTLTAMILCGAPDESREFPERTKFEAALQEATSRGMIQFRCYGERTWPQACAILTSGHYQVIPGSNVEDVPLRTKHSQYEFFVLADILTRHNVTSPLFVEGLQRGKTARMTLSVGTSHGTVEVHSCEGQKLLVGDRDRFIRCMDQCMRESHAPFFGEFGNYPNIKGVHTSEMMKRIKGHIRSAGAFENEFKMKYRPPHRQEGHVVHDEVFVNLRGSIPMVFINRAWHPAREVFDDCVRYLEAMRQCDTLDAVREDEVMELLVSHATASVVPMTWTGSVHAERLRRRCVAQGMCTYLVLPASDKEVILSEKWPSDPAGQRDVGIVLQLQNLAAQCLCR